MDLNLKKFLIRERSLFRPWLIKGQVRGLSQNINKHAKNGTPEEMTTVLDRSKGISHKKKIMEYQEKLRKYRWRKGSN